ncbi:MAG TPA: tRNA 2-selenouridine(34) synthase MnmH [Ignavibacteria bacterium]|nr:tRNA 2-selenouridine(34) synthase MnmH [Ignavibacteria bacterium]
MEKSFLNFKNDKELFSFIRFVNIPEIPPLKSIFKKYNFEEIELNELLSNIPEKRFLIIDARSESEFESSHLSNAINFPVLNNSERHYVGNLYKNYSQKSAIWLAMEYANIKKESLKKFINNNLTLDSKSVYVYCWRGGGRSKYLSSMISDLFPNLKINILKKGFKSYRNIVNEFFENEINDYKFIELTGLTGCNKSKLIEFCSGKIPTINLENAARHQSSLFGDIPYTLRGLPSIKDQSSFENNLFNDFILNRTFYKKRHFLIESESRKIGNFNIPKNLFRKISESPSILVESEIEYRIKTIKEDYFGNNLEGLDLIRERFINKGDFFKQQLSKDLYYEMLEALNEVNVDKFIEYMLVRYYDIRYKNKGKKPVLVLKNNNLEETAGKLTDFLKNYGYTD